MPRLKSQKPRISELPPSIGRSLQCTPDWYRTAAWQRLRLFVFLRDNYRCAECDQIIHDRKQRVAHHVQPHEGNPDLFWKLDNLITVCSRCHNSAIQQRELRDKIKRPVLTQK
jgi:5-methylcytosine-specific restriction endonuclease McrA